MEQPLVSVVVPVFNGLPYLEEAYASIRAQTYPRVEVVLVDGGSSDASPEFLARAADEGARVSYLPQGTPAAETWTAATRAASGDLVKLLCQDDLLHPTALARQVADLTSQPAAAMAVAQRDVVSASGAVLYRRRGCSGLVEGRQSGADALLAAYRAGTNVFGEPLAVLFRRQAVLDAMPWSDARPFLLDLDTYTAVLDRPGTSLVVRKESIGAFRVSTSSWSTRLAESQQAQFRTWQREYELRHPVGRGERTRAAAALRLQTQLRRAAYAWLRLKGDLS